MTTQDIVHTDFGLPTQTETTERFKAIRAFQQAVRQHLVAGTDYGVIPGTGNKPTMLKPGAEKMAKLLNLTDEYEVVQSVEDWDRPLFRYMVRCRLTQMGTGVLVSTGLGECNSMESRYRYRWLFKSDLERQGIKSDGLVTRQIRTKNGPAKQYRMDNEDVYSQVNTILKMAKKRALVDAALSAGRLSEIFTQDVEDLDENGVIDATSRVVDDPPADKTAESPAHGAQRPAPPKGKADPLDPLTRDQRRALFDLGYKSAEEILGVLGAQTVREWLGTVEGRTDGDAMRLLRETKNQENANAPS